jgi:hypothetical protein
VLLNKLVNTNFQGRRPSCAKGERLIIEDTDGVELLFNIPRFFRFSLVFDDTTDELKSLIEFGGCFTVKAVVKPSFIRQVVARRQPDFRKL